MNSVDPIENLVMTRVHCRKEDPKERQVDTLTLHLGYFVSFSMSSLRVLRVENKRGVEGNINGTGRRTRHTATRPTI